MKALDGTVAYVHLRTFDHTLANPRTPDWLIYLRAVEAGFAGIVTRDWHQSVQAEEMLTLSMTPLVVISWRRAIEDPVVEWGQLLAYMPSIRRLMEQARQSVIFLPQPSLQKDALRSAQDELGTLAKAEGISNQQLRTRARDAMLRELDRRGLSDRLARFLQPRRRPQQRRG